MTDTAKDTEKKVEIKAYHKWELCLLYDVGDKAFTAWLKPFAEKIGKQRGQKYTPDQVKIIFECLGAP